MKTEATPLAGVFVLTPEIHRDDRGFFLESYRRDVFAAELGIEPVFVQDNHSRSAKNVLRGLHFQWQPSMGKLMRVTAGSAFVVAVDLRKDSPTLGQWHGLELSARNSKQVWAPAGFARGFCALADDTEVQYKCTAIYHPGGEAGIRWNDPDVAIRWPVDQPVLSDKDSTAQSLAQWLGRPEADAFKL